MIKMQPLRGFSLKLSKDTSELNHRQIADLLWPIATKTIIDTGKHDPVVIYTTNDSLRYLDMTPLFKDEAGKNEVAVICHELAQDMSVTSISIIAEAWTLRGNQLDNISREEISKLNVSQNPQRVEVLIMTTEMRKHTGCYSRTGDISREADGSVSSVINCEDTMTFDNEGRFSNFFTVGAA